MMHDGRTDIVIITEHKKKAKKRPIGPLPVQQAVLVNEISKLLPAIHSGEWLTDEHINNAQAIQAKHFHTLAANRRYGFLFQRAVNPWVPVLLNRNSSK